MKKYLLYIYFALLCVTSTAQVELPFKPNDEFEAKIDLSFKERKGEDVNTFKFNDDTGKKKTVGRPIAFLAINFKMLKANGAIKVKSIQGVQGKTQKIKENIVVHLEMGFLEDIKSTDVPNELVLNFLDDQKIEICKVVFLITEDGTFLVNGEKRGKF
jgi:hypothetical protein